MLDEPANRQLVDDHPGGKLPVVCLHRLPGRLGELAMPPQPPRRPPAQLKDLAGPVVPELQPEHLGEQRVIAVPAVMERLDQRVRLRQRRENVPRIVITGQFGGDPGVHAVKDRGFQQQVPHLGGLRIENLFHQVAGDRAVLSHEFLDELLRVRVAPHGDRGEAERGNPALRPLGEELQRLAGQRDAVMSHEDAGLVHAERKLVRPDFGELAREPVAVQRQQRIAARGNHDAQEGPGVPEQPGQPTQAPLISHQMKVVQHQQER